MRIVSLAPSNTEILHALGLLPQVVGVDNFSDWPPEVAGLPRVGPDLDVDMDRVLALRPDLVVASLSVPGMERNVARLERLGIRHVVCDPHRFDDLWDDIRRVAAAAGVPERAGPVIAALQERVERVRQATRAARWRPRLYWEWWPRPLFSPGGRNWLTQLSEWAGGTNVFAHVDADCVRPNLDEVVAAAPDFILAAWTGVWAQRIPLDRIASRPGWDRVPAVQAGRVYALEEGKYNRPSPRLVDGLEELARLLHPDLFPGA